MVTIQIVYYSTIIKQLKSTKFIVDLKDGTYVKPLLLIQPRLRDAYDLSDRPITTSHVTYKFTVSCNT